jgi:hypothetical protein
MRKIINFIVSCFLFAGAILPAYADGTINVATGAGDGSGWTFSGTTVSITAAGAYELTGVTTVNSVTVASGLTVDITLKNVDIQTPRPFYITPSNTTVNLILEGVNTLKSTSGGNAGLSVYQNTTVNISGSGSLAATGSVSGENGGAGIGSSQNTAAGTININSGIITAVSLSKAAAIGGGYHGSYGYVTVSGGVVTANGAAAGIGNYNAGQNGTFTLNGNGIVFTNSISDTDLSRRTSGILFIGDEGKFYGTAVSPTNDAVIESNNRLIVEEGQTLTIDAGKTFTSTGYLTVTGAAVNSGTFVNKGNLTVYGTFHNNAELINEGTIDGEIIGQVPEIKDYTIDVTSLTSSGEGYTFTDGVLALTSTGSNYILKGTSESVRISVPSGKSVNVTLQNLNITSSQSSITIEPSASAVLILSGNNALTSENGAGIYVATNASVTVAGSGALTTVGKGGAGIGGLTNGASGTITILAGTVTANSTSYTGIGGTAASQIYINGGTVTATSKLGKAGISGSLFMNGNAIVFASSISDATRKEGGIIFLTNKGEGLLYGTSITPTASFTIPSNCLLTIEIGRSLVIGSGLTMTNLGTVNINGKLEIEGTVDNQGIINNYGILTGTVAGNPANSVTPQTFEINLATVNASGAGYTLSGNTLSLTQTGAKYILTGTASKSVEVAAGLSVQVILQNVNIESGRAFYIHPTSSVAMTVEGDNTLKSTTAGNAGLGVPKTAKIMIDGTGSLTAIGAGGTAAGGAGIGGNATSTEKVSAGMIVINGGYIYALADKNAAGIGGGYHSYFEEIIINGGFVTAESSNGDGIGGYSGDETSTTGVFMMSGNAIVCASSIRDKSRFNSGLLLHGGGDCRLKTNELTIDRNLKFPVGASLTLGTGQTLHIQAGDTVILPPSAVIVIDNGATLNNEGVIKIYQETSISKKGNLTGSGEIKLETLDYDNRERLYFHFHILANCLFDGTKTTTLSESDIASSQNMVIDFEKFFEKHAPNINAVTKTTVHREVTHAQGTGNENYFSGTAPLDPNCMDVFIAKATGSPSYSAYYIGDYIHLRQGCNAQVMMHEYGHHIQALATGYDQDDGQPWEHLFHRYDSMYMYQWAIIVKDAGEHWNEDNQWIYPDTLEQTRPANVVFPTSATLTLGQTLANASYTGASGAGTFSFSNSTFAPWESMNGYLFKMVFIPDDDTEYPLTQDVPVTFTGIKRAAAIGVSQSNIFYPQTPDPSVYTSPVALPVTVSYKQQGAGNETYTTTVPAEPGKYTVRVKFDGDADFLPAVDYDNFIIYSPTEIVLPAIDSEPVGITAGDGFIKINTKNMQQKSLLRIYTLTGALYTAKYISAEETVIPAKRGMYIVNCEGARKKVIVK